MLWGYVKSPSVKERHVRRSLSHRWFRISAIAAAVVALFVAGEAWYFRIYSYRDVKAYHYMHRECHPVWKDLALRRIKPGDDVEELIANTSPARIHRHGEYTTIYYQGGLSFTEVVVVARDGRLVWAEAVSCTWDHTFFDEMNSEGRKDYWRSFESYVDQKLQERSRAEVNEKP